MGCGSSKNKSNVSPTPDDGGGDYSTPPTPHRLRGFLQNPSPEPFSLGSRPPPLTFEVPIERIASGVTSNGTVIIAESLVRQHPPRRLLRLEEQPVTLTHQLLDDRLAEADLRRQKILNQRIQSANVRKHRRRPLSMDTDWRISGSDDPDDDYKPNSTVIAYI